MLCRFPNALKYVIVPEEKYPDETCRVRAPLLTVSCSLELTREAGDDLYVSDDCRYLFRQLSQLDITPQMHTHIKKQVSTAQSDTITLTDGQRNALYNSTHMQMARETTYRLQRTFDLYNSTQPYSQNKCHTHINKHVN